MKRPYLLAILITIALLLPLNVLASTAATRENIPTEGMGLSVAVLNYEPSPAQPGKFVTLFIKAENSGGNLIENSRFILIPKYPFTIKRGEATEKTFGTIGSEQQVLLKYELFVDNSATEGTYEMPLRLCTNYDCTSYKETPVNIAVNTGGTPKVEVGLEDFDIISPQKTGTVTFHIINRGNLNTKYALLDLIETNDFELLTPNKIYIGKLESDDFETAEFKLYIKSTDKQTIDLPVRIQYTDANDKDYDQTTTLKLKIYSQEQLLQMGLMQKSKAPTYYSLIALLIAIYISFRIVKFILRKRSKHAR